MHRRSNASKTARHALECELTSCVPDAAVRAEMAAFYRTNECYARQQASHPPEYFSRLLSVMNVVLSQPRARIVEIGAGVAGALQAFLRTRPQVRAIAVELSPGLLRAANEKGNETLHAVAGNALQLPFQDGSVDAVVAFEVIEHLPDVAQALDEILRVVRRPGHIIIGLPNHASLWTPVEDALRRRDRRAFGVEGGRGAWRWWRRNAALAWRKRVSPHAEFLYRQPILDTARGGDADAVYYAAPLDLLRFFRSRGATLVTTSTELRLGFVGRLLPVEMQGSSVLAWCVNGDAVEQ
jgi:SAM-dependent methyltransferase